MRRMELDAKIWYGASLCHLESSPKGASKRYFIFLKCHEPAAWISDNISLFSLAWFSPPPSAEVSCSGSFYEPAALSLGAWSMYALRGIARLRSGLPRGVRSNFRRWALRQDHNAALWAVRRRRLTMEWHRRPSFRNRLGYSIKEKLA